MKLFLSVLFLLFGLQNAGASDIKTYIPEKAKFYGPMVLSEGLKYMPDSPSHAYFMSLIEQESCIHLKHKRCWDPSSELKSSREQGVGLGQITRAFRTDGTTRFDVLSEMKQKYKDDLSELSWLTIKQRPDLQIRTMVFMVRDLYKSLYLVKDPYSRLHMVDSAYNGGLGGLKKERTQCSLTKGCDPQQWFGHVERVCLKSKKPLYGNRNACDINREHPELIFHIRLSKYQKFFNTP